LDKTKKVLTSQYYPFLISYAILFIILCKPVLRQSFLRQNGRRISFKDLNGVVLELVQVVALLLIIFGEEKGKESQK